MKKLIIPSDWQVMPDGKPPAGPSSRASVSPVSPRLFRPIKSDFKAEPYFRLVTGAEPGPEQLVGAYRVQPHPADRARISTLRGLLPEPLTLGRPLADAALGGIVGQEPVARPRQRIEAAELTRPLALPAESASVGTIQTEDPHLEVASVGHEDFPGRPEGHAVNAAELFR